MTEWKLQQVSTSRILSPLFNITRQSSCRVVAWETTLHFPRPAHCYFIPALNFRLRFARLLSWSNVVFLPLFLSAWLLFFRTGMLELEKWQTSDVVSVLTSFLGHVIRFNWFILWESNLLHISSICNGRRHINNWKCKTCHRNSVWFLCRKRFCSSKAFHQHRRSGYLLGTGCHVLDDGPLSGPSQSFGGPLARKYVHSHASDTQGKAKAPQYCMPVMSKEAK
jgi:hypothetical protein